MRAPLSPSALSESRYDLGMCAAASAVTASAGIGSDGGVQHDRQVGDGPRQRAGHVLGGGKGNHARPARQPSSGAQAHEILIGGGNPNRSARVAAHARGRQARTDGRPGAAARSTGHAGEVVGIACLAGQRRDRRDAGGQLVHRRLAEDDRAGVAEPFHLKRVGSRAEASPAPAFPPSSACPPCRSCP